MLASCSVAALLDELLRSTRQAFRPRLFVCECTNEAEVFFDVIEEGETKMDGVRCTSTYLFHEHVATCTLASCWTEFLVTNGALESKSNLLSVSTGMAIVQKQPNKNRM